MRAVSRVETRETRRPAGYFGVVLLLVSVGGVVVGGGRAEPLELDGAGLAWVAPGLDVVLDVVLGVVSLELGVVLVVAAALAPAGVAAPLEAKLEPAHQSFFARCEGEAFMYALSSA